jgi:hypothetical protein
VSTATENWSVVGKRWNGALLLVVDLPDGSPGTVRADATDIFTFAPMTPTGLVLDGTGIQVLHDRVLEEMFSVLEPAALAATAQALADAERAHAANLRGFELTVERTRYEADRGRRQYDAVEPENRLVARALEGALEAKLAAQRQAEHDLLAAQARRPVRLTDDELAWFSSAGADVPAVFTAPSTTFRERKQLLRAVVSEVVVTVNTATRTAALRIIWQVGGSTDLTMPLTRTGGHFRATDEDTVELVRRLAAHYDDTTIALILSRQHRRTGTGLPFTKAGCTRCGSPAASPPTGRQKLSHPTPMMPSQERPSWTV